MAPRWQNLGQQDLNAKTILGTRTHTNTYFPLNHFIELTNNLSVFIYVFAIKYREALAQESLLWGGVGVVRIGIRGGSGQRSWVTEEQSREPHPSSAPGVCSVGLAELCTPVGEAENFIRDAEPKICLQNMRCSNWVIVWYAANFRPLPRKSL